ncbi:hypothetical protein ILYODFUR_015974 [Ilyodon furcidens]|uniref:Uncharacterized protein n=1 Tax=Ilyodon furcidens TaxID=33524 RepID=A0ABV0VEG0_9TELE
MNLYLTFAADVLEIQECLDLCFVCLFPSRCECIFGSCLPFLAWLDGPGAAGVESPSGRQRGRGTSQTGCGQKGHQVATWRETMLAEVCTGNFRNMHYCL